MVEYIPPVVPEPTVTALTTTSGSHGGNGGNEWMIVAGVGLALFLLSFVFCMARFFPSKNLRTFIRTASKHFLS